MAQKKVFPEETIHTGRSNRSFFVLKGQIQVILDEGIIKTDIYLNAIESGLLIMPMVWATICPTEDDSIYLVLCDDKYLESEYIRDKKEFMELVRGKE